MDQNFLFRGFTDIFKVSIDKELCNLQKLIYLNTKNYLIKHKKKFRKYFLDFQLFEIF